MTQERDQEPTALSLEEITQLAKETLLRDGTHRPTLIAEGSTNMLIARITPMGDTHEERMQQMFRVGFMLADTDQIGELQQAFFISEAWMSTGEDGKPPHLPPSQDPKRREILIVSRFQTQSDGVELVILEMVRDHEGLLTDVQAVPEVQDTQAMAHSPLLLAFSAGYIVLQAQPD